MQPDTDTQQPNVTALERERLSAEREGRLIDLIDTNFSANGLRYPLERLHDTVARYLRDARYRPHSQGDPAARAAIAEWYRRDAALSVSPDAVIITASASESYGLIFQALATQGDRVLLPQPGYPLFEHVAAYHRLTTGSYPLRFDEGFRITEEALERAVTPDCRFLVMISPNNPTGRMAGPAEVAALLRVCRRHRLILICDEVFSPYRYPPDAAGQRPPLPRPMAAAEDVLVLTINGISKLRATPELKLSWIVAHGPVSTQSEAVDALALANDMYLSCTPLSQHLLPHLLGDLDHEQWLSRSVAERRGTLLERVDRIGVMELSLPDGGIHAVARLRLDALPKHLRDDEQFALRLLRDTGVHLHPGYLYGITDDQCLVLSFLKAPNPLAEGLERVWEWARQFVR
ncbi:MAG: pyridoxal phosphate-dependent aminotransferase [Spirochaetaceae bacterium]|nr:MAG: pyridoxal phosphate-dependent aminotransferase [Spirochaetaceae bacterium]